MCILYIGQAECRIHRKSPKEYFFKITMVGFPDSHQNRLLDLILMTTKCRIYFEDLSLPTKLLATKPTVLPQNKQPQKSYCHNGPQQNVPNTKQTKYKIYKLYLATKCTKLQNMTICKMYQPTNIPS